MNLPRLQRCVEAAALLINKPEPLPPWGPVVGGLLGSERQTGKMDSHAYQDGLATHMEDWVSVALRPGHILECSGKKTSYVHF